MNEAIRECFHQAVDGNAQDYGSKQKTDRQVHADALIRMKNVESVLEFLLEAGFEDMTLQELYNEISGQAHLG